MKTYNRFINEGLPPHLAKFVKNDTKMSVTDRTPSFDKPITISVPIVNRMEVKYLLKKNGIRFTSRGTSSGEFIFSGKDQAVKAKKLIDDAKIKIMTTTL